MWEKLQKLLDRAESRIALWQVVQGSGVLGAGTLTALLSKGVGWIDEFGWFGWWLAFLIGCVLAAAALALLALVKLRLAQAHAFNEWAGKADPINPLDKDFHKKRIYLRDFTNPLLPKIHEKRFTDCEIVGPAAIFFSNGTTLSHNRFIGCDFIPTKRNAGIANAIEFSNSAAINSKFIGITFFVHPDIMKAMEQSGTKPYYVSLTGDAQIDSRQQ